MASPHLAGLHFTGSTGTFQHLWRTIGENLSNYRSYPRVVGETGGKDFIVAHPSADPEALAVAMLRGGFEYQGQKCSAASRVYLPQSLWPAVRDRVISGLDQMKMGDVRDFSNFIGAVIDKKAFTRHGEYQALARGTAKVLSGGQSDSSHGWFVEPTFVEVEDPRHRLMEEEIFGPILPIVSYGSLDEAIHYINDRPRTLALYFFGYDKTQQQHVVDNTHSGGMCINDSLMHVAQDDLPFGGIGDSGMGHYHGREGFLTFSHHRAIFTKQKFNSGKFVYAPHGTTAHKLVYKFFIR